MCSQIDVAKLGARWSKALLVLVKHGLSRTCSFEEDGFAWIISAWTDVQDVQDVQDVPDA